MPPLAEPQHAFFTLTSVVVPVLAHLAFMSVGCVCAHCGVAGRCAGQFLSRRADRHVLSRRRLPTAVARIGAPGLHFHDLRHTGNTLAAPSAHSTKDLMARTGHDSMNAAIIYQHATAQADRAMADDMDMRLRAALRLPGARAEGAPQGVAQSG